MREDSHIEIVQGLSKFYQPGLPNRLPDDTARQLDNESELQGLRRDRSAEGKKRYRSRLKALKAKALERHQLDWIQRRQDFYVHTWGEEEPQNRSRIEIMRTMWLIIP
jgi:hypothetical protein